MKKIILILTVCYLKLVCCDERKDLNNLFSLPDFNNSLNVATGEWIESSTDYETAGPHPLVLKRLFCPSLGASDGLTPEWQFSLPHFHHGGIPILEWQGYKYVYNEKRELVRAENRFGQSVKIERPSENRMTLAVAGKQKIDYWFEKIGGHPYLKRVKRPGQSDRLYSYKESHGNILLKKRDETQGRYLEWEHDKEGRVIRTLAPAGCTTEPKPLMSVVYLEGKTAVANPYGYKKIYTYNKAGQITKVEHYLEKLVKTEELAWCLDQLLYHKIYDGKGDLLAARHLEYDAEQRLVKETWEKETEKYSKTFQYDKDGRLILEADGEKTLSYRWEKDLLVYKKEGSIETFYSYNDKGLPTEEKVQEGADSRITVIGPYTKEGLPEKLVSYYNGTPVETKTYTYSSEGWVLSETIETEKGIGSLVYERDAAGRVLASTNEKGEVETFEYDTHGNLVRHASLGETKEMRYDYMNRLISEKDLAYYTYDLLGNALSKTDENGNTTRFSYDGLGRLVRVEEPLVMTLDGPMTPVTAYEYDAFDRIVKKIEPRGDTTFTSYNLKGRPLEIIYPDLTREAFEYSPSGKLMKKLGRDGTEAVYAYDDAGRLIRMESFYEGERVYEKELAYRLDKVIWEKESGIEATPAYLPNGDLDKIAVNNEFVIVAPKQKEMEPLPEVDFKIEQSKRVNELGQWVRETLYTTDSGIKVVKVYDALNRVVLTEKYDPMGRLATKKERVYDLNGDVVKETFQGIENRYVRGACGKIIEMIEASNTPHQRKTTYRYYNDNLTIVKPDGVTLHFSYERNRLKELKSSDGTIHYRFHNEGNRLVRADDLLTGNTTAREYNALNLVTKETLLNGLQIAYEYDEKGRPVSLKLPDSSFIAYSYENGLRVSRRDVEGHERYSHRFLEDHEEMILGLGALTTTWDKSGRPLSITSPYRTEEYAYDSDLKSIKVDGNGAHQFTYDPFHRLIQDNDDCFDYDERGNLKPYNCDALNRITSDGYHYDLNGNMIESPEFTFRYDALNRLIEVKGVARYTYDPFNRRMSRNETRFFWDGEEEIGSYDEAISDLKIVAKGKIVACEIEGIPFAVQSDFKNSPVLYINREGKKESGPFSLQGKRQDPDTGLIYFGARDYDPALRRFISTDPKGYADGFNLYHYAHNNPNRYNDHFGRTSIADIANEPFSYGWYALQSIHRSLNSFRDWINSFSGLGAAYKYLQEATEVLLGKGFIAAAGGYSQEGQSGIFGNGEINDKVRVTFIHGILNIRSDLIDNLRQLSQAHGGINVHYLFRPTQGFAWDILKCLSIKFGFVSGEARELVRIWKSLIEEMGGTNGGGKIVHYAHSLGGTDTFTALSYLTPEEQGMIDIRTLGSATLIPQEGYYSVINYVSVRDGVSYFDAFRYIQALFSESNIIFIGTFAGIPFKDHPLASDSYQAVIRALGQAFLETYG